MFFGWLPACLHACLACLFCWPNAQATHRIHHLSKPRRALSTALTRWAFLHAVQGSRVPCRYSQPETLVITASPHITRPHQALDADFIARSSIVTGTCDPLCRASCCSHCRGRYCGATRGVSHFHVNLPRVRGTVLTCPLSVFADAAVDDPIVAGADAEDVLAALPDVSPAWLQSEAIKESRREYLTSGVRHGAADDDVHGKRLCRAVNTVPLPTLPTRCWVLYDFISQHLAIQTALVDWAASLQHCPWQATPRSHRCFKHGSSPCAASRSCWRRRFARPVPARTTSLTPLHLLLKASAVC